MTLLGIGAKVFDSSSNSSPVSNDKPYYCGYSESTLQYTSTSWSGLHNIIASWINDFEFDITRSNSDFTFIQSGIYYFGLTVNAGALNSILGFRLRDQTNLLKASIAGWAGGSPDSPQMHFNSLLAINANDVLTLQYCRQGGSNSSFTAVTVNTQVLSTMRLNIFKVSDIVA